MKLKIFSAFGASILLLGFFTLRTAEVQAGSLCKPQEKIVFSCDLKNTKTVSMCEGPASQPPYLEYRFGKPSKVEMAFRATPGKQHHVFHRADIVGANNAVDSIWFKKDGHVYDIAMPARGTPGVQVWRHGEMLANLECKGGWGGAQGKGQTSSRLVIDHGSLDVSEVDKLWETD